MLHQAGQARAGDIDGGARPVWLRAVLALAAAITVGIHVALLSVLTIAVHGEKVAPSLGGCNVIRELYENSRRQLDPHAKPGREIDPLLVIVGFLRGMCGKPKPQAQGPQSSIYEDTTRRKRLH